MRELDKDLGNIYEKDGYYFLEKIYDNLYDLIDEENLLKRNAISKGFVIEDYSWQIEDNPYYYIETIMNDYQTDNIETIRYVFKLKLKYIK